ncbi:MAG TPA: GAF domain-containing protein [Pseudonocardiaceae bacterium]|nr:GAF domain-containing protein [Pseudonocardiaceae bacterium]
MLGGLRGTWLSQLSPTRQVAAWVLAVAGPALLTLAALELLSSLVLGGFLFCTLLVVMAVAVIGGTWPALAGVVLGVLAREFFVVFPVDMPGGDLRPNLVSLVAFTVAGVAVSILIGELVRLAEEQAALRRVATLVAHAIPAEELFAVVTEEVGRLVAVDFVRLGRSDSDDSLTAVAAWSRTGDHFPVGSRWPLAGELAISVSRTGRPARLDNIASASGPLGVDSREQGIRSAAAVPITVEGHVWGVMLTGSSLKRASPAGTEACLACFADLLAAAISNADSRAGITRLAQEQAALRRVATLVAHKAPAEEVFSAVAEEVGQLLPVDSASICRYESDSTLTFVAQWGSVVGSLPVGSRWTLGGHNLGTLVFKSGRPARVDSYADSSSGPLGAPIREEGLRSAVATPIIVQGRLWGVIAAGSILEQPLPSDTEARLASFTELVATAISNAENLAELTASRARVVAAADDTRRRIERDLHDGAQQRLVSLALALRAAQAAVPPGLGDLGGELAEVGGGLVSVMDDLRETARGIHPAILSEGGLAAALKMLARRSAVPVEVIVHADARLPERIEVAAYYVVSEALTNAAKHAHASVVQVSAATTGQVLHLHVRDDGTGGADPVRGSGLIGLKDRVEALGGTITIDSPAGAGTCLHAELPLAG